MTIDQGRTFFGSRPPGRTPAEFERIQRARAENLLARGDVAGANEAIGRIRTPGQHSATTRGESLRARRIAEGGATS